MKWGVRRFQKKDGTLTNAGKKRYSDDDTSDKKDKVTHRQVLEKKYRDSGMSESEAKAAADKRIKIEKAVAVTAGLTIAACAAYYAKNKYAETYCDQILKTGTTFYNLDSTANPRPGEHLYVNYRQNDNNYFRGHFAVNKMQKTGSVFSHELTATSNVKIPSLNTRKNVFKQLYESDEQFREAFNTHSHGVKGATTPMITYKSMWSTFGDKDTPEFNVAKRKYFDALAQKGYNAIVDEWDTSKGVFRSDAPLILLNTSDKAFGEMTIKELTSKDILLSQANSRWYEPVRSLKTAAGLPHTNHFKESSKRLAKEAARSAENSKYIDKVMGSLTAEEATTLLKSRKGSAVAYAGKYMTKNSNLSVNEALSRAKKRKNVEDTAMILAGFGITYSPFAAYNKYDQSRYVKQYMKENPNTELSYKQIKQTKGYNDNVKKYIEAHPNTKLSYSEIVKLYYGL